ncbi:ABC transporter ATP-binding protein [Patescibacteria group bacterium]|nr:ABC transporter ATP-binding protein [Patescibacteria group bacterium]
MKIDSGINNIVIKLDQVSKEYILHHQKPTLVENIFKLGHSESILALKNINLEIKRGEKIGIIGDNGSGKTTLLKIISGITTPTKGRVVVKGRIATLVDLEAGFHPDLTGEENIFINGMLLGMSKKEINNQFYKIIEYSGLSKFIDAPFYTYSSGMRLRLGFAIAIHSNPDILLLDEVLAVGDGEFQEKTYTTIQNLINEKKTIIYISHILPVITKLCQKVIWINKGTIQDIGRSDKMVKNYQVGLNILTKSILIG